MRTPGIMIVAAAVLLAATASAQEYDLVIVGGRVMDPETRYDAVANVGIEDGRIEIITDLPIRGVEEIDATGLVVAPGFIDTHYHAVEPFGVRMALRDGVTTGMDMEQGATSVAQWYEAKDKSGWPLNYGTTFMMIGARMMVHDAEVKIEEPIDLSNMNQFINASALDGVQGWSLSRSDIAQMNQVMQIMDEGLREGALGIGVGAAYMAPGLTTYELFEAQRLASRYGRLTAVHTRFHTSSQTPIEATLGVDEILANALLLKAPLLLCHDNDYGWWEAEEKLQMARAQGLNVWGEYYPYDAGSTGISADFLKPANWEAKQGYKYEETIYDPSIDKYLTKQEYLDTVAKDPARNVVVFFPARKAWIPFWLRMPDFVVASDAMPGFGKDGKPYPVDMDPKLYAGHPRASGTYALTLQLARDANVPLMFTLSQLSYWNAKHMGDAGIAAMKERGRVQVGKIADLTLFNPATVASRSSYKVGEQGLPPTGIPYVIVNGVIALKNGEVVGVNAGQSIRYPVEPKGTFEPINVNKWLDEHALKTQGAQAPDDTGSTAVIGR